MSAKKKFNNDSIVIDTSVLIEYLENTALGNKFFNKILSNPQIHKFYIAPIVDIELKYVLCRRKGYEKALDIIALFLKDFTIYTKENLRDEVAYLKCYFAISLADCYGLAIAKLLAIPFYMKKEEEIEKLYEKLSTTINLKFIDDLD